MKVDVIYARAPFQHPDVRPLGTIRCRLFGHPWGRVEIRVEGSEVREVRTSCGRCAAYEVADEPVPPPPPAPRRPFTVHGRADGRFANPTAREA